MVQTFGQNQQQRAVTFQHSFPRCAEIGKEINGAISIFDSELSQSEKYQLIIKTKAETIFNKSISPNGYSSLSLEVDFTIAEDQELYLTYLDSGGQELAEEILFIYALDQLNPIIQHNTCSSNANGSITLSSNEDNSFKWSSGETTNSINNLSPGEYIVTINNNQQCERVVDFVVYENSNPDPVFSKLQIDCNGERKTYLVAYFEDAEHMEFDWNVDGFGDWENESLISIPSEGRYRLKVRFEKGCEESFIVNSRRLNPVEFKANPTSLYSTEKINDSWYQFDLNKALNINFGDLDNDKANGSIYEVSFHNSLLEAELGINPLNTDFYSEPKTIYARLQSSLSCFDITELRLSVAPQIDVELNLSQNEACQQDAVIRLSGGLPEGGLYQLSDRDNDNQCCDNSILFDNETGDYFFDPSVGAGTYDIEYVYTNEAGMTHSAIESLTIHAVDFEFFPMMDNICNTGERIEIATVQSNQIISGVGIESEVHTRENQEFTSYFFNPIGLEVGTYEIFSEYVNNFNSNNNACFLSKSKFVNIVLAPEVQIVLAAKEFCHDSDIHMTSNVSNNGPNATYEWSGPDGILSANQDLTLENTTAEQSGTYYFAVTNEKGCTVQDFIEISIREKMELNISEEQPISCFGESDGIALATMSKDSDSYRFLWDNGINTAEAKNLEAGIHRVSVTDDLGCTTENSIGLIEPDAMALEFEVLEDIVCFGAKNGKLKINVSGGTGPFTFEWGTGQKIAQATNLETGLHHVTVTDQNQCVSEESYFLEQPEELSIDIVSVTHLNCFADTNGEASIDITGGTLPYDIEWANGQTEKSVTALHGGEHLVIVTDAIGCNTARVITIEEPTETLIEVIDITSQICGADPSGNATLRIEGPSSYRVRWDNGELGLTANKLSSGSHNVTIVDELNCEIIYQVEVSLETNMQCVASQLSPATCQTSANGVASVSGDRSDMIVSYQWDNGETTAVASALTPGIHFVTLTDENGCTTSCNVTIDIAAPIQLACNNVVNYSLAGNCQLNFTPSLVVQNYTRDFEYSLSLSDENGNEVDTMMIKDYVGQTLDYVITETCKLNSCWGKIRLEDKFGPDLNCKTRTIDCVAHMGDFTEAVIPLEDIAEHWLMDESTLEAKTYTDCSLISMHYADDVIEKSCDNPFSHIIKRNWTATDEYENTSSCVQQINIFREEVELIWPADTSYIYCMHESMDTEVHEDMSPDILGKPHQKGMKNVENHPSPCDAIDYIFNDQLVQTCTGKYKLLREWVALQHCSDYRANFTQTIHVIAEDFDLVQQDTIVKIKSGFDCKTDMLLPISTPNYCSKFTSYSARIYTEADMEECIVYREKPGTQPLAMLENNVLLIPELELGCNYIEVYLTSDCNNSDTLNFYTTVVDKQAPVLICDAETVVSLGSNGIGFLTVDNVDNGSWDNCGIDNIQLTKQDSICELDSINIHTDKVSFCCEEAWTNVMVIMTVTDFSDNLSTCKINVTVEDNAYPHIDCPDNVSLPCTVDLLDFSITGSPISEQLCSELQYFHIDSTKHHECKNQKRDRFWYTVIGRDTNFICTQTIELFNENPFTEKNIKWPDDVELEGCTANLSVEYLGSPIIDTLDGCELIATNFIDKEFDASLGSCISILREWTIIDWCQFNENEDGIWRNSQVIKIHDTVKPTLTCEDIEVCIENRDCTGQIDLLFDASDDCTSSDQLKFNYQIDLGIDGNLDVQLNNQTNNLITDLPAGQHEINIYVEDLCDNMSHCKTALAVKDCKAPTPYCIAQTVSAIFDENDQTEVWANDFNLASRDNCTSDENLSFSFEKERDVLSRSFNCEDIVLNGSGLFSISIWVKDEAGNQDACYVKIRIDQNDGQACDDFNPGNSLRISGNVKDVNGDALQNFEVFINNNSSPNRQVSVDETKGSFQMANAQIDHNYEIRFSKEDNFNHGISTADMITLQNHLIGYKEIENEFIRLAADVNRDGRLSTADLLMIKRLIIGQIESFPAYDSPWVFAGDRNYLNQLSDVEFMTQSMDANLYLDFRAYKIGDIDGSANRSDFSQSETRSDINESDDLIVSDASVFPNPMMEESTLSFNVQNQADPLAITIIDQSGKILWREVRSYAVGQHDIELNQTRQISVAGMYYVLLEQRHFRQSIKLIKL